MYRVHQSNDHLRQVELLLETHLYPRVRRHRLALPRLVREALNRLRPYPTPAAI